MSVTIDWGDGTTDEKPEADGATHKYSAGGSYVISVRRPDDPTPEAVAFEAVAPPGASLTLTATADPNNSLMARVTVEGGTAPYVFDFGDTGLKNYAASPDGSHTYATAGKFTISAIDSAPQAAYGSAEFQAKAPPEKELELDAAVDGSDPLKCNLTIAGAQGKSQIVWGDGAQEMTTDASPTAISHTYAPKGEPYVIAATDGFNHGRTSFIAAQPGNQAPTVTEAAPASAPATP